MKNINYLIIVLLITTLNARSQDFSLSSPGDVNEIKVYLGDKITYEVLHRGVLILEQSPISLTVNGKTLGQQPRARKPINRTENNTINPVVKEKRSTIQDHYRELEIPFRGGYSLIFRAYDDGIAYRFKTLIRGDITIDNEQIVYNFPKDHQASFPIADGFFTHYERGSVTQKLSALNTDMSCLPVLIFGDNDRKVVISEADLYDYPGFYLKQGDSGNSLQAVFPHYPKNYDITSDRDVVPRERENYLARTTGRRVFPWRLMVISDKDSDLLQNQLVYKLSRPLQLTQTDWIKPGMVAWDWYNANNLFGVDFESGINTESYKYYIDFASKYGLEYIILDEGWYDIKTNDLIHPVPTIDMPALVAYGGEKKVDLILWVTWKALEDNLVGALDQFAQWGIKGIKVDFMQRDDQWMVQYYHRVAQAAADRHMLVDFHGSYKPSGLRRAYPNVISREGVRGLEQNKWVGQMANPENDLVIPFTRMLAGPVDYTPGAMRNAQRHNYNAVFDRPMSLGTRCHQLAMYVIFESPLQMLADSPSNYLKEEECMQFLSAVPTEWDQTEVLDARFSDYVLMARKNGETWYVGAMTDWDARDLELDLSFLEPGSYNIRYYQDGINAEKFAEDYQMIDKGVTNTDKLSIHMASGGGWVAIITRQ